MTNFPAYEGRALEPALFPTWDSVVPVADVDFEIAIMEALDLLQKANVDSARDRLHSARSFLSTDEPYRLSSGLLKLAKSYHALGDIALAVETAKESLMALCPVLHSVPLEEDDPSLYFLHSERSRFVWELAPLYTYGIYSQEQGRIDEARAAFGVVRESFAAHNELRLYASALYDTGVAESRNGRQASANFYSNEALRLKASLGICTRSCHASNQISVEDDMPASGMSPNPEEFLALDIPDLHDDLKSELADQGRLPSRVGPARRLLEAALILQYQRLAHGMFTHRLLRGEETSGASWWTHYCNMTGEERDLHPDLSSERFLAFRRRTAQDAALRRIQPVSFDALYDQMVIILGCKVRCWEEGAINRQLAALGSSLRLLVVDSDSARKRRVFEQFVWRFSGHTDLPSSRPLDGRFILGWVAPWSAFQRASVYDFQKEVVAAPHMEYGVTGFVDQGRCVIRPESLRAEIYPHQDADRPDSSAQRNDFRVRYDPLSFYRLIHEYQHIIDFGWARRGGSLSSWRDVIRQDICRLARSPCEPIHIARAFAWIYSADRDLAGPGNEVSPLALLEEEVRIDDFMALREDINDLLACGLLERDSSNRLLCPTLREDSECPPYVM
jgi:tetratricopeptide (TPR) repeat protein